MTKILLFLLLINGHFIFSQNSESIDRVEFVYAIGGSSWGKDGIFSRKEVIEFQKTDNGNFKISKRLKINEKVVAKVFSIDTIKINSTEYKTIPKDEMDNLLISLNTNEDNFTEEFLKKNFNKPSKKEIFKIVKDNDNRDYLKNIYDEKSDTEKKYAAIQEFNYFDEYLQLNKPNINEFNVTMDSWNYLGVMTFSKKETKLYTINFFNYCGQPISVDCIEINEKVKKVNILENKNIPIINLNVNLILQKIVPKNTKLSSALNLNNIRNQYIKWFIENKRI